jgi:Tfp pilus assembly protein PilO
METKEPVLNPENAPEAKAPSRLFTDYYGSAVLTLFALFLVVAFGFLRPVIDDIKQVNAESSSLLQNAENERAYLKSLENSIAAAQGIPASVLEQVTQALPNETNVPSLLVHFGSAATRNGVRLNSLAITEPKMTAPAGAKEVQPQAFPIDINLSVSAKNYFDVKRFLMDLETSLRLMDVVAITSGNAADGADLSYAIQLKTYQFGVPQKPGATTNVK